MATAIARRVKLRMGDPLEIKPSAPLRGRMPCLVNGARFCWIALVAR
jgi:hypothetical protein